MYRVTYRKAEGVEGLAEVPTERALTTLLNWLMEEPLESIQVSNLDCEPGLEPYWFY